MKIEFNLMHAEVPGHVIDFVRDKLMDFHRENKEVANAEVSFRQIPWELKDSYVCQVIITLFGESLLVQRSSSSYLQSARDVIKEISIRIEELLKRIKEPPEEVVTTVDI
jgi:ribosome-associated translation inhibitor RaiA